MLRLRIYTFKLRSILHARVTCRHYIDVGQKEASDVNRVQRLAKANRANIISIKSNQYTRAQRKIHLKATVNNYRLDRER